MAMNINVTFIIQIGNFWVFYFLFSRYLLRPFFDYVAKKSASKKAMLADFAHQELTLKNLVNTKSVLLESFRKEMHDKYLVQDRPVIEVPEDVLNAEISGQAVDGAVDTISDYVIKKVCYAHRK